MSIAIGVLTPVFTKRKTSKGVRMQKRTQTHPQMTDTCFYAIFFTLVKREFLGNFSKMILFVEVIKAVILLFYFVVDY